MVEGPKGPAGGELCLLHAIERASTNPLTDVYEAETKLKFVKSVSTDGIVCQCLEIFYEIDLLIRL